MHALWTPSPERVARTHLARFMAERRAEGVRVDHYDALYAWSLAQPAAFWRAVWDFAELRASAAPSSILADAAMPGARWFDGARFNFAENLLRAPSDTAALLECWENGDLRETTYGELRGLVARFARFLRSQGVVAGDRVAGFMPNRREAVVAMLAASSLGAVWSSCSPDFGFRSVLDRFGQIAPKVLIAADGYRYNGKAFDSLERVAEVARAIPSATAVVVVPLLAERPDLSGVPNAIAWAGALAEDDGPPLTFAQLPFDHPLYILYSSGTTGVPKCIVHGQGGTLLQHAKELLLHSDVHADDTLFYFTTTGWMMWNWLVSGLLTGARVVLYEGSPSWPDVGHLWRLAEAHGFTHFGTSPKFLSACEKAGWRPLERVSLPALRCVLSTGSPLSIDNFAWVYECVKADVQLASISGGTDIVSCFMLGVPTEPVFPGEIQRRGLGMAVEAWRAEGEPVVGEKGELVCVAPFPSMPVGFWNDPNGEKYHAAYFGHFPGVWRHGDFIEITARGGVIVYGRSDATLNPGGVRIGTAEIDRQVESFDEVLDSVVVGLPRGDDVEVTLFVVLRPGVPFDEALVRRLKARIRENTTPRHVPTHIAACPAIPRTISGKKVELGVLAALTGQPIGNRDALANPEALDFFVDLGAAGWPG